MGKQVWKEVCELAEREFTQRGFRRFALNSDAAEFVRDYNSEILTKVTLMRSDRYGALPDVTVRVSIQAVNKPIEQVLREIMKRKFRPRDAMGWAGVGKGLGDIIPRKHYGMWRFREGRDHEPEMQDLMGAIETYGWPYVATHGPLAAMAEHLLQRRTAGGGDYGIPVAYYLLGSHDKARQLLEEELQNLGSWPGGSANDEWVLDHEKRVREYQEFAAELRRRFDPSTGTEGKPA